MINYIQYLSIIYTPAAALKQYIIHLQIAVSTLCCRNNEGGATEEDMHICSYVHKHIGTLATHPREQHVSGCILSPFAEASLLSLHR